MASNARFPLFDYGYLGLPMQSYYCFCMLATILRGVVWSSSSGRRTRGGGGGAVVLLLLLKPVAGN